MRSPHPEKEGTAKTMCNELTVTHIPCPPVLLGGAGGREKGLKLSPGRRERWGQGVLRSGFISYCPSRFDW